MHGVVAQATEIELAETQSPISAVLRPPLIRAAMMTKSYIYLDKTIRRTVEQVLTRTSLGAALSPSERSGRLTASDDLASYATPRLTFAWRLEDERRIDDPTARPYIVQYDESDLDFVSRLLEEEGISYHFEHGDDECLLVLTDFDGGRIVMADGEPVGPRLKGREVFDVRVSGTLLPRSVHLDDYDWRKPNLDLRSISPSGVTDFTTIEHPGRYEHSKEHGLVLAEKREQRIDTERSVAVAEGHCRALTAAAVVGLEHPRISLSGTYLVTAVRHHAVHKDDARGSEDAESYRQKLELVRCGDAERVAESRFRPARLTPRPRIYGTQTAVVTADPSSPDAEINVGGPGDLGCVRVRFRWDMDSARCEQEPSSCWVRVSQFFAGADHGAMWHPRVGDEVIVEYTTAIRIGPSSPAACTTGSICLPRMPPSGRRTARSRASAAPTTATSTPSRSKICRAPKS